MTSLTGSVYRQTCVTCIIRFSVYIENHLLLPCLGTVMELPFPLHVLISSLSLSFPLRVLISGPLFEVVAG